MSKILLRPDLQWEKKVGYPSLLVVGVDEVGRGCLAGPVTAGAVILPSEISLETHPWVAEITDSKKLTPEKREKLAPLIEEWALAWAVCEASVEEIEKINIYWASHLAMRRAVEEIAKSHAISHILIDGNVVPQGLAAEATPIVKGDLLCLSVAAASIIAKVRRDRMMAEMDAVYPGYGFAGHKGYSTPVHQRALKENGACPIHRRSFAPVAEILKRAGTAVET